MMQAVHGPFIFELYGVTRMACLPMLMPVFSEVKETWNVDGGMPTRIDEKFG